MSEIRLTVPTKSIKVLLKILFSLFFSSQDIEGLLLLLDPGGKGYLNFEDFCRGIVASMQGKCQRSNCLLPCQ